MTIFLEVRNLSKNFGGVQAVNDVSFDVERGAICSLVGPNGAGKTTLFNMISGLVRASSGKIFLSGDDISTYPPHKMPKIGLGRTFQNLALFTHLSVVDNLLVGMHSKLKSTVLENTVFWGRTRIEEIRAREKVEEIIDFLEIQKMRDLPAGTLSYGLQKRVELGRALAMSPQMILLDEMVSGMNQEETEDIARFILDIRDELGITVLMIEHDMGIVQDISDKIVVLNFGRKIGEGTPQDTLKSQVVIDAYLGALAE